MWLAAIFFICILALLAYLDTRKPKNYPPGKKILINPTSKLWDFSYILIAIVTISAALWAKTQYVLKKFIAQFLADSADKLQNIT